MDQFELLENIFTPEQLFLIAATSVPEIEIDYENQTIKFNTINKDMPYSREQIGNFLNTSRSRIEEYKNSLATQNLEVNENVTANILWIEHQLRLLEQYLNT